jgi:PleD family two-component response regulator
MSEAKVHSSVSSSDLGGLETAPILVPPIRPGHVLIVDDDPQARRLLCRLLEATGHRVTEAGDGKTALDAVRREPPDVILLDVVMPALNGFEVCRRVKSDPATALIHILMITSLTDREHRLKAIECGANDFLTKPVEREEVLLRVRNAVWAKQTMDELQQRRGMEAAEDTLQRRLRGLSASDAGLALALLTVGAEMLAWRVAVGQLDKPDRDRLYGVYEQLSAALAKSGTPPV